MRSCSPWAARPTPTHSDTLLSINSVLNLAHTSSITPLYVPDTTLFIGVRWWLGTGYWKNDTYIV